MKKKRSWEMKLGDVCLNRFEEILRDMKAKIGIFCPYPDGAVAATNDEICNDLCGELFPSLAKENPRLVKCPCSSISYPHKIKVVTKLLKFNGRM